VSLHNPQPFSRSFASQLELHSKLQTAAQGLKIHIPPVSQGTGGATAASAGPSGHGHGTTTITLPGLSITTRTSVPSATPPSLVPPPPAVSSLATALVSGQDTGPILNQARPSTSSGAGPNTMAHIINMRRPRTVGSMIGRNHEGEFVVAPQPSMDLSQTAAKERLGLPKSAAASITRSGRGGQSLSITDTSIPQVSPIISMAHVASNPTASPAMTSATATIIGTLGEVGQVNPIALTVAASNVPIATTAAGVPVAAIPTSRATHALAEAMSMGSHLQQGDVPSLLNSSLHGPKSSARTTSPTRAFSARGNTQTRTAVDESNDPLEVAAKEASEAIGANNDRSLNGMDVFQQWVKESFRVRALLTELKSVAETNERLELENALLRRKTVGSRRAAEVENLEQATAAAQAQLLALEAAHRRYMTERAKILETLNQTSDSLDAEQRARRTLEEEKKLLADKVKDLAENAKLLEENYVRATKECADSMKEADKLRQQLAEAMAKIESVTQAHEETLIALRRAERQSFETAMRSNDFEQQLHRALLKLQDNDVLISQLELERTKLVANIRDLEQNKSHTLNELEIELQKQRAEAATFLNAASKARDREMQLAAELAERQAQYEAHLAAATEKCLKEQEAHRQTALELEEAKQIIREAKQELEEEREKRAQLKEELIAVERARDAYKSELEDTKLMLEQMKAQLKDLEELLNKVQAHLATALKTQKMFEQRALAAEAEAAKLTREVTQLTTSLHDLTKEFQDLKVKYEDLLATHHRCEYKINRSQDEVKATRQELDESRHRLDILRAQLEQQQKQMTQLMQSLESVRKEKDSLFESAKKYVPYSRASMCSSL